MLDFVTFVANEYQDVLMYGLVIMLKINSGNAIRAMTVMKEVPFLNSNHKSVVFHQMSYILFIDFIVC